MKICETKRNETGEPRQKDAIKQITSLMYSVADGKMRNASAQRQTSLRKRIFT